MCGCDLLDLRNLSPESAQFRENEFYDSSAVAMGVVGRDSKARYLNESTVQLSVPAGRKKFTVLIASAASFDPAVDTASLARATLEVATPRGFAGLQAETAAMSMIFPLAAHVSESWCLGEQNRR